MLVQKSELTPCTYIMYGWTFWEVLRLASSSFVESIAFERNKTRIRHNQKLSQKSVYLKSLTINHDDWQIFDFIMDKVVLYIDAIKSI